MNCKHIDIKQNYLLTWDTFPYLDDICLAEVLVYLYITLLHNLFTLNPKIVTFDNKTQSVVIF